MSVLSAEYDLLILQIRSALVAALRRPEALDFALNLISRKPYEVYLAYRKADLGYCGEDVTVNR